MADVQKAKGNTAGAYAELKKAFESNSLELENSLEMMLSILERSTKLDPEVLELAQILQRNHPQHFMTHVIVGDILKRDGNYLSAVEAFESALSLEKNNFQLWQEVVSLHYLSYAYKVCFNKAESALELHPSQPLFYYYAGMSALKLKQFDDAQEYLDAGKDIVVRDQAMKAQFELALAELQLAQNKTPQARKYLDKVQQLTPNDKLMMNNRAYLMATYKLDLDNALVLIQTALQGNERDPLFLDTEAWVYFARNEFKKALLSIEKAYALAPKNHDINEHYGDILFQLGNVDEAVNFWKKSQELGNLKPELSNKIKNKKL
jgi:tetratricopeptide (TPR) repeat protein